MKTAKVLVSDKLSDSGLHVLESAPGIEVDYRPGLSEQELADAIGDYDALVIRSGSKVTAKVLESADRCRSSAAPASASTTSTCRPPAARASS